MSACVGEGGVAVQNGQTRRISRTRLEALSDVSSRKNKEEPGRKRGGRTWLVKSSIGLWPADLSGSV